MAPNYFVLSYVEANWSITRSIISFNTTIRPCNRRYRFIDIPHYFTTTIMKCSNYYFVVLLYG